ncbi:MAG: zinc ABC transporter substrate-binding protein [Ruminococcaceae bacterium]|nr:zinc ABC transporter substrate-binding protein [Oscillospiraceae bacterium]
MKKIFALVLCAVMLCSMFPGCSSEAVRKSGRISVVTTIFPIYDWCREILGDELENTDLTMLLDSGVDLHSYQPTAADLIRISDCDVFIYVGGESDEWVEDVLAGDGNPDMKVVNLLTVLGDLAKEEEIVEGMEADHDHDHDEDHDEEHEHEEEGPEYDEHVWLSLKNASILVDALTDALASADADRADVYRSNASAYKNRLGELDAKYAEAVKAGSKSTLVFGDRFPFRYLVDDYGLDYYAAFVGCSAETEASFQTIVFLAQKTDELGLNAICQIESADGSIARTVAENTASGEKTVLTFDSLQSVTAKDVSDGVTYLAVMEKNLDVLRDALK